MYRKCSFVFALGVALVLACGTAASAKVLFEYWFDIGGTNIDNDLRTQCSFPDGPSQSELRDNLKSIVDWRDNYGLRARAYLTPPTDGYYTFWVSGDDNCQLWLSTDDTAAKAKLIAQVAGWTPAETWDWEAGQKSGGILLTGGQKYYVEMLLKEGGGGDSVTAAWAGPTIGSDPCVIAAEYLTEYVRTSSPAYCPNPANGATEWVTPLLQWSSSASAVLHNVYLGTTPDLTQADFKMAMPMPLYPAGVLTPGTTYYWRVDDVMMDGSISTGNVWSFTTMPVKAHFPNPSDGAQFRKTNLTVSWTAGQNATKHTLYGGTDQAAVAAGDASTLIGQVTETSVDTTPLQLESATTYYWRVDETDASGVVTPGDVWSFTTSDPNAAAVAEYWDNMTFDGAPKVVTTVPEINFDWGGDLVPGTNSPDPCIPVDKFTCRWSAELQVPVTGTYTLYEASDDGSRLYLNGKQVAWGWWDRGTTEDATAPLELVAGEKYQLVMEMYENGGGATAFLRWSGPGYPKEIIPQGALVAPQLPVIAYRPSPADGASGQADTSMLSWAAGLGAVQHNLYFGTDEALVAAGDASVAQGTVTETTFDPGVLTWGATYFWKVDAVAADGAVTPGLVWSFSVAASKVIDDFEAYDLVEPMEPAVAPIGWWKLNGDLLDSSGNGHDGTAIGDGIGFEDDPMMGTVLSLPGGDHKYVEIGPVGISGNMPTTIACWAKADNTSIPDWTLIFGFTGTADGQGGNGSHFNIGSIGGPGGVGAHCWGWEETIFTDQEALEWRHYAMTYDGTTILYYGDGLGKDTDPGKSNVQDLSIRGDRVFIGKRVTQESSFPGNVSDARVYNYVLSPAEIMSVANVAANLLSTAWTTDGTVTAAAVDDVAHNGKSMKLDYDNSMAPNMGSASLSFAEPMDMTRGGAQVISMWVLGDAANAPETLSLVLEDSAGAIAVAADPNPAATQMGVWWKVSIPLSSFTGVDLTAITKLSIGIGTGVAGGAGTIYVDDISIASPTAVISKVVRANGQSGTKDPIGAFDGNTQPLATQAGGLIDGNLIFSDRTYPWSKTPSELMGADYVRTFNNDKAKGEKNVTYTVTIDRPTIVFITVDDRIPAEWNGGGLITSQQDAADYVTAPFAAPGTFVDTGLNLYVHENATTDTPMSVYAAELDAGTYVFGPMWSDKNFYIIGAVK